MLPLVNDAYEALTPYIPGKPVTETERELGITGVIKLASNENPYGPSPKATRAVAAALGSLHDYPDGGGYYLKQGLAKHHTIAPEQIILGNGTNEIIELVVRTCLRPGENILYADPSFIVYKLIAQAMGAAIKDVKLTPDLRYDLPAMARACDNNTKMVFIGNPNNPTGTYVSKGELDAFLSKIPADVLVVMDEAYFEFAQASDYPDGMDYLGKRERLLILRTFSKCYGLAGLRVGYGVGSPSLIGYLNRGRQAFNVNSLGLVGALAALDDKEHLAKTVEGNRVEMGRVVPQLRAMDLKVYDSQANFVLVDFPKPGQEVFSAMLREGVIIRPMGPYGLHESARITLGTPAQNDRLLAALRRVLGRS